MKPAAAWIAGFGLLAAVPCAADMAPADVAGTWSAVNTTLDATCGTFQLPVPKTRNGPVELSSFGPATVRYDPHHQDPEEVDFVDLHWDPAARRYAGSYSRAVEGAIGTVDIWIRFPTADRFEGGAILQGRSEVCNLTIRWRIDGSRPDRSAARGKPAKKRRPKPAARPAGRLESPRTVPPVQTDVPGLEGPADLEQALDPDRPLTPAELFERANIEPGTTESPSESEPRDPNLPLTPAELFERETTVSDPGPSASEHTSETEPRDPNRPLTPAEQLERDTIVSDPGPSASENTSETEPHDGDIGPRPTNGPRDLERALGDDDNLTPDQRMRRETPPQDNDGDGTSDGDIGPRPTTGPRDLEQALGDDDNLTPDQRMRRETPPQDNGDEGGAGGDGR